MVAWKETAAVDAFLVEDLSNPVGQAGTNDSVAIVSAAVAVYRAVRAILK